VHSQYEKRRPHALLGSRRNARKSSLPRMPRDGGTTRSHRPERSHRGRTKATFCVKEGKRAKSDFLLGGGGGIEAHPLLGRALKKEKRSIILEGRKKGGKKEEKKTTTHEHSTHWKKIRETASMLAGFNSTE